MNARSARRDILGIRRSPHRDPRGFGLPRAGSDMRRSPLRSNAPPGGTATLRGNAPPAGIRAALCGEGGFSVVELLIALTLMAFLATSLLTIITTGSGAFQKVLDEKNAQNEARIAISYITVKLRQTGSRERVGVIPSDSGSYTGNVLKIDDISAAAAGESDYIYFEEAAGGGAGRLVEKRSTAPRVGDPAGASKIADISGFDVSYGNDAHTLINISVSCDAPGGPVSREVSIALRAR